jgi:hypothetical protein
LVSTSGVRVVPTGGLKGQQHDQGVLEQVVVERAEKLRSEKRRKAAGAEQTKLGTHAVFLK